jgi:hypothetical protein
MRKPRKRERVYVPNERLIAARERLYASAADAARAMGVPEPTYQAHENGSRGLGRSAKRYAAFFRVTTDWLLGRTAPMRGNQLVIPLTGRVGAGSRVEYEHDVAELAKGDTIALPGDREIKALVVQGDSQLPRYRDGEIVLYDARPVTPGDLVGPVRDRRHLRRPPPDQAAPPRLRRQPMEPGVAGDQRDRGRRRTDRRRLSRARHADGQIGGFASCRIRA